MDENKLIKISPHMVSGAEKEKNEHRPLDIAEKGSKIGSDWFDELIKKDFPKKHEKI